MSKHFSETKITNMKKKKKMAQNWAVHPAHQAFSNSNQTKGSALSNKLDLFLFTYKRTDSEVAWRMMRQPDMIWRINSWTLDPRLDAKSMNDEFGRGTFQDTARHKS